MGRKKIEDIIKDNICLDGWFIKQRNKSNDRKNENSINNVLSNEKIRNSDEIFIVTDRKNANSVNRMNTQQSNNIKKQREKTVEERGRVKTLEFIDIQQDIETKKTQIISERLKKR